MVKIVDNLLTPEEFEKLNKICKKGMKFLPIALGKNCLLYTSPSPRD